MLDEYDYIICGGGTSGCVVASRLADDLNVRILIIEAGDHNKDIENVHMAGGMSRLAGTDHDWRISTVPQKHCNDREIPLFRGKFLGGSSGVNGTLCVRGTKQDYDDWDMPGWSGDEMFEAMKKAETFHGKEWFKAAPHAHGTDGPLHVTPHDLAPISERVLESLQSKGFPLDHDMFSTGERPFGCGHAPRTVHEGTRSTAADYVVNERYRQNIGILVRTVVDKVNFISQDGKLRASSVDTVFAHGSRRTFQARREIIISGGAYCTPPILMRSGIGSKQHLEEHGIKCLVDAPGVGANLRDHAIVFVFYETEAGLTNDFQLHHGDSFLRSREQWRKDRTGFLSSYPFGAFAYARVDERLKDNPDWQAALRSASPGRDPMGLTPKQPNLEFFQLECFPMGPEGSQQPWDPKEGEHAFAMITELFSPRSVGSVTLKSADPMDNPVVDHNYLSDPLDLFVLSEGVQWGHEIVTQGGGTKDVVKGSWPRTFLHPSYSLHADKL